MGDLTIHTLIHIYRQFSVASLPTCKFLDSGRTCENMQNATQMVSQAQDRNDGHGAVRWLCYLLCNHAAQLL